MTPTDPKTNSLSPDALGPALAAAYDLAGPVTCAWLSSGLNDVFRVTTAAGLYVLKVYRAGWRSEAEVLDETLALLHLQRRGVRVALPIARRDGALAGTLGAASDVRPAALFTHAEGSAITEPEESHCRQFGELLAEVHNATDDFTAAPVRYDVENLLDRPLGMLVPFLEGRPDDRDYLRDLVARLRRGIERFPDDALDWGYCHGDFRPANLHLDTATGHVTAFDFELGGRGFRAYDIAYMQTILHPVVRNLLWRAPTLEGHERTWAAFLQGYGGRRPLRPAEVEAIPLFVAIRPLQVMGILLQTARQSHGRETWPPTEADGLPGGDLFDRALHFLRTWDVASL
jgi:Ser/Thr protein kinase RdoA (MazF antagonist)